MATLIENATAVKAASTAIDAAIVAKGGTTSGGLENAAAAIAALPSGGEPNYPLPWKASTSGTYLWFYQVPNNARTVYFTAQYVAKSGFTVDWGDGTVQDIAASTTLTTRALSHGYSDAGAHEVSVTGYDRVVLNQNFPFGDPTTENASSVIALRQFQSDCSLTTYASNNAIFCTGVVAAYFTEATSLFRTFRYAGAVREVYAPKATTLGVDTFAYAHKLTTFDFPELVTLGLSAFVGNKNIVVADYPKLTTIGGTAFDGCTGLREIRLPSLTYMTALAFRNCSNIEKVGDMPELTGFGHYEFYLNKNLKEVGDLSKVADFRSNLFNGCTALRSVGDMSSATNIASNAFTGCPLESVTFRSRTHTEVEAITGFTNFPNRGRSLVFHCSDGDFYRSGSSLLPLEDQP